MDQYIICVFVEDCDGEKLLYVDQFILKPQYAEEDHHMTFTVPLYEPLPPNYFVSLISDRWLHAETKLPLSFKHLILPSKFPPHTELLDLQPLPITALHTKEFIELYSDRGWQFFNPIQTQCFNPLYMTDDNVFIGAPSGSGKTVCAELAILCLWAKAAKTEEDAGKIVFIAPFEGLCCERCTFWHNQFEVFDKEVVMLMGETSADLKLINQGDLIVATPEHWDAISHRWRQCRGVQAMSLFIVDVIGGTNGHVMELIISRTRFMATQLEKPIRIVALSASLGNTRDLGEWIGCGSQTSSSSTVFNFHPNVQPVPLEVHLQSSTNPHFASLMVPYTGMMGSLQLWRSCGKHMFTWALSILSLDLQSLQGRVQSNHDGYLLRSWMMMVITSNTNIAQSRRASYSVRVLITSLQLRPQVPRLGCE